jgi:hypothetical protein
LDNKSARELLSLHVRVTLGGLSVLNDSRSCLLRLNWYDNDTITVERFRSPKDMHNYRTPTLMHKIGCYLGHEVGMMISHFCLSIWTAAHSYGQEVFAMSSWRIANPAYQ